MTQRSILTGVAFAILLVPPYVSHAARKQDAQSVVPAKADPVAEAKKHFSFAVQRKNNGDYDEAVRQYEKSITFCDTLYQVQYSYADLLVKLERNAEAKQVLLHVVSLEPGHYNSLAVLAKLYYDEAEYDSSLVMYEHMSRLDPKDMNVLAGIAGLTDYLGRNDEALATYERLVDAGKDSYENLMRTAQLAHGIGDDGKARDYAVRALDKKPGDIDALKLAALTSRAVDDSEAAAGFLRILASGDAPDMQVVVQLESLYRALADNDNLVWALARHHELAPTDIEVLGELSELLYTLGRMDDALEYIGKGMELDARDGRFHILMGGNYAALDQMDKALAEYRLALRDEVWKSSAQRLIWQIERPESAEEKQEREFFTRAKGE